jgi:hypothetical protein
MALYSLSPLIPIIVFHQDVMPIPPKPLFITPSLSSSPSFRRLSSKPPNFAAKGPIAIFIWPLWPGEPDPKLAEGRASLTESEA